MRDSQAKAALRSLRSIAADLGGFFLFQFFGQSHWRYLFCSCAQVFPGVLLAATFLISLLLSNRTEQCAMGLQKAAKQRTD